jgi:hypothetical protein
VVVEEGGHGHIFNAQSCSYAVLVVEQHVMKAQRLSEAFLLAFCCYFVFDIHFPGYMRKTFVFSSPYDFGLSEKQDKTELALADKGF